jgi:hypothetical protein
MKSIYLIISLLFSLNSIAQFPAFESDKIWKGLDIDTVTNGIARIRIENYEIENDSAFLRNFWAIEEHVYENGMIDSVHFINSQTDSISMSYFFDEYGRILGQRRFGKDTWYPIINYDYNEKDHIASEKTYDRDTTPNLQTIIRYNTEFKPVLKKEFKEDNILRRYWIYEYDSCDHLIKQLYINTPNGPGVSAFGGPFEPWPNDTTTYEFTYGKACQVLTKKEFSNLELRKMTKVYYSGDTLISRTFEYSFDGEINKEYYVKNIGCFKIKGTRFLGFRKSTYEYVYEENELKEYTYTNDGQSRKRINYRTEYKTDERGNWIIKTTFENDTPKRLTKRKIIYQ